MRGRRRNIPKRYLPALHQSGQKIFGNNLVRTACILKTRPVSISLHFIVGTLQYYTVETRSFALSGEKDLDSTECLLVFFLMFWENRRFVLLFYSLLLIIIFFHIPGHPTPSTRIYPWPPPTRIRLLFSRSKRSLKIVVYYNRIDCSENINS